MDLLGSGYGAGDMDLLGSAYQSLYARGAATGKASKSMHATVQAQIKRSKKETPRGKAFAWNARKRKTLSVPKSQFDEIPTKMHPFGIMGRLSDVKGSQFRQMPSTFAQRKDGRWVQKRAKHTRTVTGKEKTRLQLVGFYRKKGLSMGEANKVAKHALSLIASGMSFDNAANEALYDEIEK